MKNQYLIPYNRYGDVNIFKKVKKNQYELVLGNTEMPYRLIGSFDNPTAIDPSGGPFLSVGFKCNDFYIINIKRENKKLLFELGEPVKNTVNDITHCIDSIRFCENEIKKQQDLKERFKETLSEILKNEKEFVSMLRNEIYDTLTDKEKDLIKEDEKRKNSSDFNNASYYNNFINPFVDNFNIVSYDYNDDKTQIRFVLDFPHEHQYLGVTGSCIVNYRKTNYIDVTKINNILKYIKP